MSDSMDHDVREVIRRRIELRERDGHERLLLNHVDLRALLDAADERDRLRIWQERVALAAGIADEVEGRGVHLESDPDIAAEHMAGLLSLVDTHAECPVYCGGCGETLADAWCDHCHGSGCGPGTATGAYEECKWCAGAGKVHLGCADRCYAELVAERDRLEAATEQVRALHTGSWGCSNPSHTNPAVSCPDCFIGCDACGELHPCPTIHALDGSNQ